MTRRGFTLLELMTVVAIVGILAALATLSMDSMQMQGRISGEVRRDMARMQQLRAAAVTTGDCYGILFGGTGVTQYANNFSNHVMTFRKPAGAPCGPFAEGVDRILTNDLQGAEGLSGNGDQRRANRLRWHVADLGNTFPEQDLTGTAVLQVMFDSQTGRPLFDLNGVAVTPTRLFVSFRSAVDCPNVPSAAAPCALVRRLELRPTGSANVAAADY